MTNEIEEVLDQLRAYELCDRAVVPASVVIKWSKTLQRLRQQTPATDANGSPSEVDRSVSWTGLPGFAELRSRCQFAKISWMRRSLDPAWPGANDAFNLVLRWIDELEADAKSGS
jgi:hypothetical protein